MRISKNGKPIDSVASWFEFAPPKEGKRQWVDQRSAKELARSFCGSGELCVPMELQSLLDSNPSLGHIEITEAWPEHKIALDLFRGETRNADLAALAKGRHGTVAVTVEAKADESFGELVAAVLANAPERSNIPSRIETLAAGLLGASVDISNIRYQLLHGVAASLIFAAEHEAAAAVFAVLEFRSASCSIENLERNASDLKNSLRFSDARRNHRKSVGFPVRSQFLDAARFQRDCLSSWGRQLARSEDVLSNSTLEPAARTTI